MEGDLVKKLSLEHRLRSDLYVTGVKQTKKYSSFSSDFGVQLLWWIVHLHSLHVAVYDAAMSVPPVV